MTASEDARGLFAPSAIVDPTAFFMDDLTMVWHGARILQHVRIGRACKIGSGAEIGRGSVLGDNVNISAGVFLPPNSWVGDRVFIGPNATFTDDKYPHVHEKDEAPYHAEPPYIEAEANIGANATIGPGVRIGAGATVGMGAVVTSDVNMGATAYGVPARSHVRSRLPSAVSADAPTAEELRALAASSHDSPESD